MANKLSTGFQKKGVKGSNSERQPAGEEVDPQCVNSFSLQSSPQPLIFTWFHLEEKESSQWAQDVRDRQCDQDLLKGMRLSHPPPGHGSRESSEVSVVQLRFLWNTAAQNPHTTCDLPLECRPKLMDRANLQKLPLCRGQGAAERQHSFRLPSPLLERAPPSD